MEKKLYKQMIDTPINHHLILLLKAVGEYDVEDNMDNAIYLLECCMGTSAKLQVLIRAVQLGQDERVIKKGLMKGYENHEKWNSINPLNNLS